MKENLQKLSSAFSGRRVSPQGLRHMRDSLMEDSELNRDYIVLTIGACIIASLGLLSNSAAVIIGAMLVAPLMQPIRGVAFGILEGDVDLFKEGIRALAIGTVISIVLAACLGGVLGFSEYGTEVWARSRPTLLDLGIAIAAGGISGFAKVQPRLSSTLAGTAIAVALMPPVCVIGLGLIQGLANFGKQGAFALSWGATLLYLTNLLGITLACMLAFLLAGYAPLKKARRPLGLVLATTFVLVIPLALSLFELVRQNRLEANLKNALVNETLTFKRVRLLGSKTDWLVSPPEVRLTVATIEPITPKQVTLLEDYIAQRMNRRFRLIFEVGEIKEVTNETVQPVTGETSITGTDDWLQPE